MNNQICVQRLLCPLIKYLKLNRKYFSSQLCKVNWIFIPIPIFTCTNLSYVRSQCLSLISGLQYISLKWLFGFHHSSYLHWAVGLLRFWSNGIQISQILAFALGFHQVPSRWKLSEFVDDCSSVQRSPILFMNH